MCRANEFGVETSPERLLWSPGSGTAGCRQQPSNHLSMTSPVSACLFHPVLEKSEDPLPFGPQWSCILVFCILHAPSRPFSLHVLLVFHGLLLCTMMTAMKIAFARLDAVFHVPILHFFIAHPLSCTEKMPLLRTGCDHVGHLIVVALIHLEDWRSATGAVLILLRHASTHICIH